MFRLFNLRPTANVPIRFGNDWINVRRALETNLKRVMDFYQTHSMAVKSEHLLADLIYNSAIRTTVDLDRYFAYADSSSRRLENLLGLTSSTNRGKVHDNVFFPEGCVECIISVDEYFNYEDAYVDWKNVQAVKCLRHPYSNLNLTLPNGKQNANEKGIAILEINIPLLLVQYKAFKDDERLKARIIPDYAMRTVYQFIHMHVLPNMMPSFLDHVLLNRMMKLTDSFPMGVSRDRHSFALVTVEEKLNAVQKNQLDLIISGDNNFTSMLRNVQMVDSLNLEDLMKLPEVAMTRQVMWVLFSSRLKVIKWLLEVRMKNQNKQDVSSINTLKRFFTRLRNNNEIVSQLPEEYKKYLRGEVKACIRLLNDIK